MKTAFEILLTLITLAVGFAIWAIGVEPGIVTYPEHTIHIKNWPQNLSGYTIALLSDIHAGSPHITREKLLAIVAQTNARKPDLILLAGDYVIQNVVGGTRMPSKDIATLLSGLKAPQGVYGVLGNHDWWDGEAHMVDEFNGVGIPMLEDQSRLITKDGSSFWLTGFSDYYEGPHDVKKALSVVTTGKPVIALTHTPDIFPELPDGISLLLAGHTHGGQVYVPFFGRPVIPSKYGQRYAKGLVREGEKQIFVTSGIGTSLFPIRFMTPPEVCFLHILPE